PDRSGRCLAERVHGVSGIRLAGTLPGKTLSWNAGSRVLCRPGFLSREGSDPAVKLLNQRFKLLGREGLDDVVGLLLRGGAEVLAQAHG
ncbi:hypothetical protein, partial [Streptomyces showdoensis]|uniref:hypothetical protein n=1 Tax=Streptomyces showdoensis TaxID=68268 RepID=UPI0031EB776F